jgi:hypothetical protein
MGEGVRDSGVMPLRTRTRCIGIPVPMHRSYAML